MRSGDRGRTQRPTEIRLLRQVNVWEAPHEGSTVFERYCHGHDHNSIHRAVRISIRLYGYRPLYHDRW